MRAYTFKGGAISEGISLCESQRGVVLGSRGEDGFYWVVPIVGPSTDHVLDIVVTYPRGTPVIEIDPADGSFSALVKLSLSGVKKYPSIYGGGDERIRLNDGPVRPKFFTAKGVLFHCSGRGPGKFDQDVLVTMSDGSRLTLVDNDVPFSVSNRAGFVVVDGKI